MEIDMEMDDSDMELEKNEIEMDKTDMDENKSNTVTIIRSILTSTGTSCSILKLNAQYKEETGEDIPLFGFETLRDFFDSIPDTVKVIGHDPFEEVTLVKNEKSAHIVSLVERQKVRRFSARKTSAALKRAGETRKEKYPPKKTCFTASSVQNYDYQASAFDLSKPGPSGVHFPSDNTKTVRDSDEDDDWEASACQSPPRPGLSRLHFPSDIVDTLRCSVEDDDWDAHETPSEPGTSRVHFPPDIIIEALCNSVEDDDGDGDAHKSPSEPGSSRLHFPSDIIDGLYYSVEDDDGDGDAHKSPSEPETSRLHFPSNTTERLNPFLDCVEYGDCVPYLDLQHHASVGEYCEVMPCRIINPSKFYFWFRKFRRPFLKFMEQLQLFYTKEKRIPNVPEELLMNEMLCVVLCKLHSKFRWYRAKIRNPISDKEVLVNLIDLGHSIIIFRKYVKFLHQDFRAFPRQAVMGSLVNLIPSGGQKKWSDSANRRFSKLSLYKELYAGVVKIEIFQLSVVLTDDVSGRPIYVSDILVREGYAKRKNVIDNPFVKTDEENPSSISDENQSEKSADNEGEPQPKDDSGIWNNKLQTQFNEQSSSFHHDAEPGPDKPQRRLHEVERILDWRPLAYTIDVKLFN